MEATADGIDHRVADDRRPDPARGRRARRAAPPCATSATAPGTTSPTPARRDRPGDRPRADRPRHPAGRARLHPRQHPPRVVLRRPGRDLRGRRRRADLPDQLARGVPVGDLRLRRLRDRLRGRASSSRRSPRSATSCPSLRTIIVIDPPERRASAERLRRRRARARGDHARARCASAGAARSAEELEARRAAVAPEDPFTFIYTSGTTGPPKGCVLTHGNYRAIIDMIARGRRDPAATRSSTSTSRSRTPSRC